MKISLIVSTYNRPDALAAELDSLFAQRRMPDEIIIGDDGSRDQTRRTIEAWAAKFPPPDGFPSYLARRQGFPPRNDA